MNREIKFRAWVDNDFIKEMHYPEDIQINSADAIALQFAVGFEDAYPEKNKITDWQKQIKWMQFTGLHDKNGKEIYEGDKIKCGELIGIVCFGEIDGIIGWYVDLGNMDYPIGSEINLLGQNRSIEVIGNIYENPELLKTN